MGKIRCDAGARDARRGVKYFKRPPTGPVTPYDPGCQSSACQKHRQRVHASQVQKRGPMYTPPKVAS